jgi:hypothetical protein
MQSVMACSHDGIVYGRFLLFVYNSHTLFGTSERCKTLMECRAVLKLQNTASTHLLPNKSTT